MVRFTKLLKKNHFVLKSMESAQLQHSKTGSDKQIMKPTFHYLWPYCTSRGYSRLAFSPRGKTLIIAWPFRFITMASDLCILNSIVLSVCLTGSCFIICTSDYFLIRDYMDCDYGLVCAILSSGGLCRF